MSGFFVRTRAFLESRRLQPGLNRGLRAMVSFTGPFIAAAYWHLPVEATFAVFAAQNIAIVDVRGSYSFRFGLLLAMTVIMAGSSWLGGLGGQHLASSVAAIAAVCLLGGLWLVAESGLRSFARSRFRILPRPAPGWRFLSMPPRLAAMFFSAAIGGLCKGVLVQMALWPFRPQHPLRRVVAESWLAVSDLLEAMPSVGRAIRSGNPGIGNWPGVKPLCARPWTRPPATRFLRPGPGGHARSCRHSMISISPRRGSPPGSRLSTPPLEALMAQPAGVCGALRPGFLPVLTAMTNTARSLRPDHCVPRAGTHLALVEVRLRRLTNLLHALQDRVRKAIHPSPRRSAIGRNSRANRRAGARGHSPAATPDHGTVDRAGDRAAFSPGAFSICRPWTLRPLASTLNFRWRPDPVLARFIARLTTVLEMVGVAIFKYFRGSPAVIGCPLTVLVVLQPDYGSTRLRAGQRLLGTLAGGLVASVLLSLPRCRRPRSSRSRRASRCSASPSG